MSSSPLQAAKARLTIFDIWTRLGIEGNPRKNPCHSPWARHGSASFSIKKDGTCFHDFSTGEKGDAVAFLARAAGTDTKTACRRLIEWAGARRATPMRALQRPAPRENERRKPYLDALRPPTPSELAAVATRRNVSLEACAYASKNGWLFAAEQHGQPCWAITDSSRWNCQFRRLDAEPFTWGGRGPAKAKTAFGAWASWPIGAADIGNRSRVLFCEGSGDFIAAIHFITLEAAQGEVAPVCMAGASHNIPAEALPLFSGKVIRIFPHLDTAGAAAAVRWEGQLAAAGAEVHCFDLAGLTRTDGQPLKDLNDLTSINADQFEQHRELWTLTSF